MEIVKMKRREALSLNKVRYYTGKPCQKGHLAERYALTGVCVVCAAQTQKAKRNPRRMLANGLLRITIDIKPEIESTLLELIK